MDYARAMTYKMYLGFFYWMHVSGISNVRTACNRFACIRLLSIYRQSINPSFLLQFDSAVDILSLMLLHSLYRQLKHTSLVQLKRWTMKRISTTAAAPSPSPPALSGCKNINSEKKWTNQQKKVTKWIHLLTMAVWHVYHVFLIRIVSWCMIASA